MLGHDGATGGQPDYHLPQVEEAMAHRGRDGDRHEGGAQVTVEMGRVSFDGAVIPVVGGAREVLNETLLLDGEDALSLTGEVVHHSTADTFGVEFRGLSIQDQRAVGDLIGRLHARI